jgi:hypothetical protein
MASRRLLLFAGALLLCAAEWRVVVHAYKKASRLAFGI